ncbi:hypothetical protein GOBAR_DD07684 [Gossypium barbadense]|nr:hypothetical protein GOBAR_DD07684 [Gossypium barbadense]
MTQGLYVQDRSEIAVSQPFALIPSSMSAERELGEREVSKATMVWALAHVVRLGDSITLLALLAGGNHRQFLFSYIPCDSERQHCPKVVKWNLNLLFDFLRASNDYHSIWRPQSAPLPMSSDASAPTELGTVGCNPLDSSANTAPKLEEEVQQVSPTHSISQTHLWNELSLSAPTLGQDNQPLLVVKQATPDPVLQEVNLSSLDNMLAYQLGFHPSSEEGLAIEDWSGLIQLAREKEEVKLVPFLSLYLKSSLLQMKDKLSTE